MFDTKYLKLGVPAMMLENRPDIRMANHAMEEAFYNTGAARSAFYPSITLSGTVGWTNSAGGLIVNPGKLLLNAMAQLTQPIFARGKLIANKKIAKLTEEDLQKKYVQTVINAGNGYKKCKIRTILHSIYIAYNQCFICKSVRFPFFLLYSPSCVHSVASMRCLKARANVP